jgi:adenylate cyclase
VWSARYDGTIDEIFDLQDRITEQVAGALQPSIRVAEIERSRRKRPQDLGSYDYTMRAMAHAWALEKDESAKALELLEKALAIDPQYPLALSLAGWCHAQRSVYNWAEDIAESQAKARSLAERAAVLSGDDPIILTVLGTVHTFVRNYGTARVLFERALTLDPNAAWAWSRLGWIENYTDQPHKAIENFERALRLSPLDPMFSTTTSASVRRMRWRENTSRLPHFIGARCRNDLMPAGYIEIWRQLCRAPVESKRLKRPSQR